MQNGIHYSIDATMSKYQLQIEHLIYNKYIDLIKEHLYVAMYSIYIISSALFA